VEQELLLSKPPTHNVLWLSYESLDCPTLCPLSSLTTGVLVSFLLTNHWIRGSVMHEIMTQVRRMPTDWPTE
jgi:hypothetical protein